MGVRHTGRRIAIQALYQAVTRRDSFLDFVDLFIDECDSDSTAKTWGKELAIGAWNYHKDSDKWIQDYSIGWTLDRINLIDLSILRLAFYELIQTDTPLNIVLDEAMELSKEFSTIESSNFINGILGNYVKDHVHGNR